MNTQVMPAYTLVMTAEERQTLEDILAELLKETRVELHRTEASRAQAVVAAHAAKIESLLHKLRERHEA